MERHVSTTALVGILIILVIVAGLLLSLSRVSGENKMLSISSYADCAAAGYPIEETYPQQCVTPDGRVFVAPNSSLSAPDASSTETSSSSGTSTPSVPTDVSPAY